MVSRINQYLLSHVFFYELREYRKKRKVTKDEKKHQGAVDEPSSEQQYRKLDAITLCCVKTLEPYS